MPLANQIDKFVSIDPYIHFTLAGTLLHPMANLAEIGRGELKSRANSHSIHWKAQPG
jgi:hypothetical protein